MNNHITTAWNLLKYSYGLVVLLAGIDKILGTNIIVDWPKYISPLAADYIPMSVRAFLVIIGIVEVVVAGLLLSRFEVLGGYLAAAWLVIISINLLLLNYRDIAVRDILLAIGAIALVHLTMAVRGNSRAESHA